MFKKKVAINHKIQTNFLTNIKESKLNIISSSKTLVPNLLKLFLFIIYKWRDINDNNDTNNGSV